MLNRYLPRDFVQKLDRTIFKYDGRAYYFRVAEDGVSKGFRIGEVLAAGPQPAVVVADPRSSLFDISSIELGYFNNARHTAAMYLKRHPLRRVKQAVCPASLSGSVVNAKGGHIAIVAENEVFQTSVDEGFQNSYPTLSTAVTMIHKRGFSSVAISKDVALTANNNKEFLIFLREENIGKYDPVTNVAEISTAYYGGMYSRIVSSFPWRIV